MPAPAEDGQKTIESIPSPENVPPSGVPASRLQGKVMITGKPGISGGGGGLTGSQVCGAKPEMTRRNTAVT